MSTDLIVMDQQQVVEFMREAFGYDLPWIFERFDDHGVTIRQPVDDTHMRAGNTVSGPTLMTLADAAAYLVVLSRIGPEALAVTSNLNMNFLRRPRDADLVATARVLKAGRSLILTEVVIHSADRPDEPVAHSTVTYSLALVDDRAD